MAASAKNEWEEICALTWLRDRSLINRILERSWRLHQRGKLFGALVKTAKWRVALLSSQGALPVGNLHLLMPNRQNALESSTTIPWELPASTNGTRTLRSPFIVDGGINDPRHLYIYVYTRLCFVETCIIIDCETVSLTILGI